MIDEEKPRSIRFPRSLWNAIDIEAKRCKRSAVKQMESVLATYYNLENVELNNEAIEVTRTKNQPVLLKGGKLAPHSKKKMPFKKGDSDEDTKAA